MYLHIPFCHSRCTYCDFNTTTGQETLIGRYVQALTREIRLVGGLQRLPVHTIYFGGGTPSLVSPEDVGAIIQQCRSTFDLAPDAEITLEANPGSVIQSHLHKLRQAGVNRLSIGMQSAHQRELRLFRRPHTLDDVWHATRYARQVGFDNFSLDLIYGVPHQTLAMWQHSLDTALLMNPSHLSLYSLGIEDGTPMQRWIMTGQLLPPDSDLAADMYEWACERLAAAGFEHYEISNWARPGYACQHNVHYWRNLPYLGLGAGAHGYANGQRYANIAQPAHYIDRIEGQPTPLPFPCSAATDTLESVDTAEEMSETLLMGLRLIQGGVGMADFWARFGQDMWAVFGAQFERLIAQGLLEHTDGERVRLTAKGRLLGTLVFAEFV
ncbi:MAG: radical SAM family heme chaperone HemW [Chloroflexi bacterium]|nr:radical SAM family heme chaperone HemW [Chloroflexota bacterium]